MTNITRNRMLKLGLLAALIMLLVQAVTIAYAVDLTGSMASSRALKAGDNECYRNISNINANANIKALGRNESGSWVFIWADAGDGWVPASSVRLSGNLMALSVWGSPFAGEPVCTGAVSGPTAGELLFDSKVCGRPGSQTSASTTRWTDIFRTADPDSAHIGNYEPSTSVTILGRDFWGCWVKVSGNGTTGWVPINSLNVRGVMDLRILLNNSDGCSIGNNTVVCPDA